MATAAPPKGYDPRRAMAKLECARAGVYRFVPRPDDLAEFDQQQGFLDSEAYVSICMGGNRSGKTETGAQKTARLVLWKQPPIWPRTHFLIISDTIEQVCEICWQEKLSQIIPKNQILWDEITWHNQKAGHPAQVPLKPWPNRPGKQWVLNFRAIGQDRKTFQGRRYGGMWFTEQFPWPIFEEATRGFAEVGGRYNGAIFAEFTPVDPDLCLAVEDKIEQWENGELQDWAFFRMNSLKNEATPDIALGIRRYLRGVSSGLLATRSTGALPIFAGVAYPEFNTAIHVLDDAAWQRTLGCSYGRFPPGIHRRGIDFGESESHPFTTVWGFQDNGGRWFIYDAMSIYGDLLYAQIRREIKGRWPWPETEDGQWGLTYADPSRPGIIMEFSADGIPCASARNNQLEGVLAIRNLLTVNPVTGQPSLFIHRSCKNLIQQMRQVRWIRSPAEAASERGTKLPLNPAAARYELLKWKDDEADALRYMIFSEETYKHSEYASASSQFDPHAHGISFGQPRHNDDIDTTAPSSIASGPLDKTAWRRSFGPGFRYKQ